MTASVAFIINPSCHGKQFDIDYGYQCTLNLPEALLHVWFFCQYFRLTCWIYSLSLCVDYNKLRKVRYMSRICVYDFILTAYKNV